MLICRVPSLDELDSVGDPEGGIDASCGEPRGGGPGQDERRWSKRKSGMELSEAQDHERVDWEGGKKEEVNESGVAGEALADREVSITGGFRGSPSLSGDARDRLRMS